MFLRSGITFSLLLAICRWSIIRYKCLYGLRHVPWSGMGAEWERGGWERRENCFIEIFLVSKQTRQALRVLHNIEPWKSNKYVLHIVSVRACSRSYSVCKANAPNYIFTCPALLENVSPHGLANGTIFRKMLLTINVCFDFLYNVFMLKCPLLLPDFHETWIFSTNFRKGSNNHVSSKFIQWEPSYSMRAGGRTWRNC